MKLTAKVTRGKNSGLLLYPHLYKDGTYVVSKTRFKVDYKHLDNLNEVSKYLEQGYGLRMSNPEEGIETPSLISHRVITISY